VGVTHKEEAGLVMLHSLPYKVGVLGVGHPTSQGHRKCHKRRIISMCTQNVNCEDPDLRHTISSHECAITLYSSRRFLNSVDSNHQIF